MRAGDRVKVKHQCLCWSGFTDEPATIESVWKGNKLASVVLDCGGRIDGVSISNLRRVFDKILLNDTFLSRMLKIN